jgi:DNA-binding transcriptional LysR family regulator
MRPRTRSTNRAFGLVPGFFALYESRVPADVIQLDYLDFEAKLRAKAGDGAALRSAVEHGPGVSCVPTWCGPEVAASRSDSTRT